MSIIKKCKEFFFRKKQIKHGFFEGFTFQQDDKKIQNAILTWLYKLQQNGIYISKFADLWKEFENITFPISVEQSYSGILYINLDMKDSKGVDCNIEINHLSIAKYELGMETEKLFIYRQYEAKNKKIIETKKEIIPKITNKEEEFEICFKYDRETKASLKKGKNELVIVYNQNEYEEVIYQYLTEQAGIELTEDVTSNFASLVRRLKANGKREPYSISISIIKDKITMSTINMEQGIVTDYSFTKIVNGDMRGFCKMYFEKEMEEFLRSQ